jgi:hypothetical protein
VAAACFLVDMRKAALPLPPGGTTAA